MLVCFRSFCTTIIKLRILLVQKTIFWDLSHVPAVHRYQEPTPLPQKQTRGCATLRTLPFPVLRWHGGDLTPHARLTLCQVYCVVGPPCSLPPLHLPPPKFIQYFFYQITVSVFFFFYFFKFKFKNTFHNTNRTRRLPVISLLWVPLSPQHVTWHSLTAQPFPPLYKPLYALTDSSSSTLFSLLPSHLQITGLSLSICLSINVN